MLKPIKNFLTYLQRNANSSNIFGLTTTAAAATEMGRPEQPRLEETIVIANDDLLSDNADPLYDPLALDDCPVAAVHEHEAQELNDSDQLEDDTSTGKIILVDVSTLKTRIGLGNDSETDEDANEEEDEILLSPTVLPAASGVARSSGASDDGNDQGSNGDSDHHAIPVVPGSEPEQEVLSDSGTVLLLDSSTASENDAFTVDVSDEEVSVEKTNNQDEEEPSGSCSQAIANPVSMNGHHVEAVRDQDAIMVELDEPEAACRVPDGEQMTTVAEQILPAVNVEEEEEASDGSDSGLGLEPTSTTTVALDVEILPPMKSSLKRRSQPSNTGTEGTVSVSLQEKDEGVSSHKRVKKGITFDGVTVYYFPRIQGFGCVPSQGGCTLGMESQHVHSRRLTLAEHLAEQRKVHRQQLQELNPRSSSSEDTSSEEEPSESGSEAESESYGFLQPVTARQRRSLLKAAGVRRIDPDEKDECREIRTSREVCGCTCRGFCDPNICSCSLAGIKCQVDRPSFPCGCTHEGCNNTAGRVEFNPGRVRTHFIHTIMRLSLEDKANEVRRTMDGGAGSSAVGPVGGPMVTNGGCANDGGGGVSGVAGRSVAAATAVNSTSSSNYLNASGKNWSSGPVRLPPAMDEGSMMTDHYHHQQQQQPHHHAVASHGPYHMAAAASGQHHLLPLQHPLTTYHQHHLPPHLQAGPYHGAHGGGAGGEYYAFRDFYGGTALGVPGTSTGPEHYYGHYGGSGQNSMPAPYHTQHTHHHTSPPMMIVSQQHHPASVGESVHHHHAVHNMNMMTTSHDRHTAYGDSAAGPAVPSPIAIDSSAPCTDTILPMGEPSADVSLETIVIDSADTSTTTLDDSGPIVSEPEPSTPEAQPKDTTPAEASSVTSSVPPADTIFFDLTTPSAVNAERLEAINDMLECSRRHSINLARRAAATSIVAEEDSELRDFCHSPEPFRTVAPTEPDRTTQRAVKRRDQHHLPSDTSSHLIVSDDDDDGAQAVDLGQSGARRDGDTVYLNGSGLNSEADSGTHSNGTATQSLSMVSGKCVSSPDVLETKPATLPRKLHPNLLTTEAPETAPELVTGCSAAGENDANDCVVVTEEPSENLSEIIKNSIVETAVTH
ncbi:uncharacterized protein LOC128271430 [Anopheles cruzii]|uniref:uncharacterized protein LOC128271430 n=1 Tax=Anopheles cruzii TaxID=68878 RepID=UPI0022EC7FF3|nr:uncharacterized protein LOC128271430 [Anopheles cruzii]